MNAVAVRAHDQRRVEMIHPAIDGALSAFPDRIASDAGSLLNALLDRRAEGDRLDRWSGSRLTGDGFPVELSFCTADDRLRFTVEPGAGDVQPEKRLDVVLDLLEHLGACVPTGIADTFRAMQRGATLQYGAWIGCRVGGEGHALKVYVEVPEQADTLTLPGPRLALPDRTVTMQMVAYTPATEAFEWYARIPSLEPQYVPALLAPAALEGRAGEFMALLTDAYGYAIRGRLPGSAVGVSYVTADGATSRVTVYLFARTLWGSDARIRRQFVRLAEMHGWNADTYLKVTAPIAARESWQTFHGLVGFTLEGSMTALTIGVRPVQS